MATKDEQTPPRKRTKTRAETIYISKQDPSPLIYPSAGGKPTSSRQTDDFCFDEGLADPPRTNTTVVRHSPGFPIQRTTQSMATPIPPRRQKMMTRELQPRPTQKIAQEPTRPSKLHKLKNMHWLFLIGLGMMAAVIIWIIGSAVLSWGVQRYYDFRYGVPRTYQVDQIVGHGGDGPNHPSHFIALNLNHKAVVIQLRAGDPAKSISYSTPIYNDDGNAPVILEFRDVTSDGKRDMIIYMHLPIRGQVAVFINNGDQFRPAKSNDQIKL